MAMSRKHYLRAAKILGENGISPWDVITFAFIQMFEDDNENHDRDRFRQEVAKHYTGFVPSGPPDSG